MRFSLGTAGLATLALACGCGGGSGGTTAASTTAASSASSAPANASTATHAAEAGARRGHAHGHPGKPGKGHEPSRRPAVPPGVAAALHAYVAALDAHDGERLCRLFVPGALDGVKLPVGGGCAGFSKSIGYDPPHGLPQWRDARFAEIKNVVEDAGGVRATVTIVDRYVGNPQPSIEDDVVFLKRSGRDWLIRQPSVTIYRAIATPNPPPSVLAAPGG